MDGKKIIYQQLLIILKDIHTLIKAYEDSMERLKEYDTNQKYLGQNSHFCEDIENQKYLLSKKKGKQGYDYQILALDIASLLKESGKPLSTYQIFQELNEMGYSLSRSNLSHNIMQKINGDSRINVERAYRGYWQYRLK